MTRDRPAAQTHVGLDFGSTGLRAVCSVPGEPARFITLTDAQWPWLLCEPTPSSPLPVSFPSIKGKLGSAELVRCHGESLDPFDVTVRALDAIHRLVAAPAPASIGKTLISVPAGFSPRQRAALRDAAGEAGFTDVGLIKDSVAAVMAHTGGAKDGVYLVYSMGYCGTELGLVQAAHGQFQELDHECLAVPSGSTFDEEVLIWLIRALRRSNAAADLADRDETQWRLLREEAQRVKEELSSSGRPSCHAVVADGAGSQVRTDITRTRFEALLQIYLEPTRDRAQLLLARSGLTAADVQAVLLVGAGAQLEQVSSLVTGLGQQVVHESPDCLARGAVWQAGRLGGGEAGGPGDQVAAKTAQPTGPASPRDTSPGIEQARRLIDQGRSEEAAALLRDVVEQARQLLTELAAPSSAALPRLLLLARSLVQQKRYDAAVGTSHRAWQEDPTRPDVFEAMIDIHCAAAMADHEVAHFSDAERWLRCAYGHDPSNTRVRGFLAERTYLHARELSRLGKYREASEALEQSLVWDPDHGAARELGHRLSRITSVRARGGRGARGER
ncbi:MAG: Hsp70 family protein [Pseudonocardiaceae bacterium]